MTSRLIRLAEVESRCGLRRSVIYSMARQGRFPAPIKLIGRSSAWISDEVDTWISQRIAESRAAPQAGPAAK